jgi:hypothetical protein
MSADPRAVWERYVASWQVKSRKEKLALFEGCLSPECVYADPLTRVSGWEALAAYMADFHRQIPGGHFVTSQFIAHHGRSMAKWTMRGADDAVLGEGVSYGEYDRDNRLVAMTGFFEAPQTGATAQP